MKLAAGSALLAAKRFGGAAKLAAALLAASHLGAEAAAVATPAVHGSGLRGVGPRGDALAVDLPRIPSLVGALEPEGADEAKAEAAALAAAGVPSADALEQMLLREEADPNKLGNTASAMGNLVKQLRARLDKDHKAAVKALNDSVAEIKKCRRGDPDKPFPASTVPNLIGKYKELRDKSMECIRVYTPLQANAQACNFTEKVLTDTIGKQCKPLKQKPPFSTSPCAVGSNGTETWLKRMKDMWKEKYTKYVKLESDCKNLTTVLNAQTKECAGHEKLRREKGKVCLDLFNELKTSACSWRDGLKKVCQDYDTCYVHKVAVYAKLKEDTKKQVATWKKELRTLTHMDCIIKAHGKADPATVEKCVKASTGGLDVAFPPLPTQVACTSELPKDVDPALLKECGKKVTSFSFLL